MNKTKPNLLIYICTKSLGTTTVNTLLTLFTKVGLVMSNATSHSNTDGP